MKPPRKYFDPLAIGAPRPLLELPSRLERMIHFVPPHNEKVRAKVAERVGQVDVVLGNLEDAIPIESKQAARDGLIAMAKATDFGSTGLWARVNALNSPWLIDDMTRLVGEIGDKLDVVMVPRSKANGTFTSSTNIWRCSRRATVSRGQFLCMRSWKRRKASITSRRSPPPRRACMGLALARPTSPHRAR
jgi:hypothetical protein